MIKVYQTAKGSDTPMKQLDEISLAKDYDMGMDTVVVSTDVTFQKHIGFGGAFTEAAAHNYINTKDENKKKIIEAYFNTEKGIGYTLGRTSIHGCDFSLEPYTYIEDGDYKLETFDMSREDKAVVPMLEAACKEAGQLVSLMCSPWSPPAFMKDNKDINHGGKLLKENYPVWAEYMVKYIKTMLDKGFDLKYVSVQNETEAIHTWASCIYTPQEEAEFACDYLYEELKKNGLEDKIKILIVDHNRDIIFRRVKQSMQHKGADEKIWGTAIHWYCCEKSENLTMIHNHYPNVHLFFTEGCVELAGYSGATSSKLGAGAWEHGETYGRHIIKDLNNYCEAWIDWNLLLNEQGGPNYVANYCEAPIMVDRKTDEVMINTSYYYIGHFSKFIRPGAVRLLCENDVERDLYSLAYKNPDGSVVVVVQNQSENEENLALAIDDNGTNVVLPAHSITTFVCK